MQRALQRHQEAKRRRLTSCTSLETASPTQVHTTHRTVSRSKRHVETGNQQSFGLHDHHKSVYFNGKGAGLKWKKLNGDSAVFVPTWSFSVDVWVKPDGGQNTPVNILGLYDACSTRPDVPGFFWTLGIETTDVSSKDRKATYSFNIRSHRSYRPAKIADTRSYQPNVWVHLAATYDGHMTKFYINGAKVDATEKVWGAIFSVESPACLQLLVGGDTKSRRYFRGEIGYINFVGEALAHHRIVKSMLRTGRHEQNVVLRETFDNLDEWQPLLESQPKHVASSFLSDWLEHDIGLSVPQCGQTVCDDPEVVMAYHKNPRLRSHKAIRCRIINLANSDGSHPLVLKEQIKLQAEVLRRSFKPYNISFTVEEVLVNNTVLRKKQILFGCEADKIGNGVCNAECRHQLTGNDGGDCDLNYVPCDEENKGDGKCDAECNNAMDGWDDGDCCLEDATRQLTCFDPNSPNRVYMSLNEYKMALGFENKKYLNIYFAEWTLEDLIGLSVFPWEHEVHSKLGGIVLKPRQFGLPGATKNLVHEVGHALGLWHTFHGISEMDCTHRCLEVMPSLELGDLCSDTNPTVESRECSDPETEYFACAIHKMKRTPFRNFMGYADNDCTDHFSPQQEARMHCYLDVTHKSWLQEEKPAPVPLAPRVLTDTNESVTLAWVPPVNHGASDTSLCNLCEGDGSLLQYANVASSPASNNTGIYYSPMQATGRPDSFQCEADPNAWLANFEDPLTECDSNCYLDVFFQEPVQAKRIYLWVNWNTLNGIDDLVLYDKEGRSIHLGKVHAFCDMPYTMEVFKDIKIRKICIHVNSPFVSIDAVAIQTAPDHSKCSQCADIKYRIHRKPAFPSGDHVEVNDKVFTDSDVIMGTSYTYTLTTVVSGDTSLPSPPLVHKHGSPYCGDGKLEDHESCDDGNLKDGDGCSLNCKIESFFHCRGVPSLCYKHDGDGVCEDFEKRSSVTDCGFFTPRHYDDQWADGVETDAWLQNYDCPADVIVGPPPVKQECVMEADETLSWHPCGQHFADDTYWVKTYFPRTVVAAGIIIYLGSDGMTDLSMEPSKITVSLIDEHSQVHEGGSTDVIISCRNNPIHVNLKHDLSMAFYYTKGVMIRFRNVGIAIAAVRLRSYKYLDPRGLQQCEETGHVFNPKTGACSSHPCDIPLCDLYKVNHGSEICTGNSEGDTCTVTCDKGYQLQSAVSVTTCLEGQWVDDLACVPVPCETPVVPHAKVDCGHGYRFKSKCKFECRPPAVKRGSDNVIECQWDGTWSLPLAYCEVMCSKPKLKGAAILTKECISDGLHVGTICEIRCKKGYRLQTEQERASSQLTCTDEGRWSGASCERVQCPAPDVVYHGLYSCSDSYYYGSKCTLVCPGQRKVNSTISCKHTGQWDAEFTPCPFTNATCGQPSDPEQYTLSCEGSHIGSHCSVLCNSAGKEAVASVKSPIEDTTSLINVDRITCTGQLVWYPDPLEVHCINTCEKEYIGDGYCDAANNNGGCRYDGGDCCESTVQGQEVKPFPPDCGAQCACLDPEAKENRVDQGQNMILRNNKYRRHT